MFIRFIPHSVSDETRDKYVSRETILVLFNI
jgi:hypothetical protein